MTTTKLKYKDCIQIVLSSLPSSIYWKDINGIYAGANVNAARMVGLDSGDDIIGKTDYDIVSKEKADKFRKNDKIVIATGKEICIEEEGISPDGKKLIQLSTKKPLINGKGKIIGVMGVTVDITQLKKTEEALIEKTKLLAASLESKDRFLRNMSHEMRIPLQAMLGIPQELRAQYDSLTDQQKKEYLDIAITAGDRFMALISNLLDLSKFKEGKFIMEFKKENIKNLVEGVANEFKYMHGNVTVRVGEDVPQYLVCDPFRVSQLIRNLIGNSIKHGGKDRPIYLSLSMYSERNKPFIKCTVKDEGVGIPDKEKEAIFDAFSESTRTRTNAGGTGLGLTIAKEIVLAHKGDIWVGDLEKGEAGARIHFTLSTSIAETVNASMKESE